MTTNAASIFPDPMDPSDVLDFTVDFSSLLEDSEIIDTLSLTAVVPTYYGDLGFEIDNLTTDASNKKVIFFAKVNDANQQDEVWSQSGKTAQVVVTFETSIAPRKFQRTVGIKVKQL